MIAIKWHFLEPLMASPGWFYYMCASLCVGGGGGAEGRLSLSCLNPGMLCHELERARVRAALLPTPLPRSLCLVPSTLQSY